MSGNNGSIVATLVVGVPSATVATIAYVASVRARRAATRLGQAEIDASAYDRARSLYESAITTARAETDRIREQYRGEMGDLRGEMGDLRAEIAHLRTQLEVSDTTVRDLRERITGLKTTIAELTTPGSREKP